MKNARWMALAVVCAFAARAEEPGATELERTAQPSRWRISAGARFAPGVKTRAGISSRAVMDAAGRISAAALPRGTTTTTRDSRTTTSESSETLSVTPTGRFEFDGGFIDMDDTTADPNETWYWHFDDASVFDESRGTVTVTERGADGSSGGTASSASVRGSASEAILPDMSSSREDDLWGGDFEVGYDFYVGDRLSIGIGIGATFYQGEDSARVAGSSGRATSSSTSIKTSTSATETMVFSDPSLSYAGALDDVRNDDGSIGAGTRDGHTNPYGGNNPILTLGDGAVTRTTSTATRMDATTTRVRRTIDVTADGDVEMQEIRLVLQPAWRAADWLELRGSLGAVATRVDVDADATVFVNGARSAVVSGDDADWLFAGLCGLDAVVCPYGRLELALGGDIRLGDNDMAYSAGLVRGTVELARYTFRAGLGFRF